MRNDAISVAEALGLKPQGVLLSPGPKTPNDAGIRHADARRDAWRDRGLRAGHAPSRDPHRAALPHPRRLRRPTKQFVTVDEVAAIAVFLCTDGAKQMTGANLSVDGGWTAE